MGDVERASREASGWDSAGGPTIEIVTDLGVGAFIGRFPDDVLVDVVRN